MSGKLFFSGRTLQQAILAAARHFSLEPDEVAYSPRERQGGFIKNPKTVIEVDPSAPRRKEASMPLTPARPPEKAAPPAGRPAPMEAAPRTARPAATPAEPSTLNPAAVLQEAREAAELLVRLAGLEVAVDVRLDLASRECFVTLEGADSGRLVARDGELLDVFEHLLPRLLRGLLGESVFCRVDSGGYRAVREERLRQLALAAAETVKREGRPHSLPEMPPAERRIVHLTLENDPSVTTASHGDGFMKSVTVSPA
jgi:spoIIIJ-associated protein